MLWSLLSCTILCAVFSSSNLWICFLLWTSWSSISLILASSSSSALSGPLLSSGDPPELLAFPWVLLTDGFLPVLGAEMDLGFLVDDPFSLPTGRLSRSASSIAGLCLLTESERCALVTCENDPVSGLLCIMLLLALSFASSIASTGAAWSNENSPELISSGSHGKLSARISQGPDTADNLRIALNLLY